MPFLLLPAPAGTLLICLSVTHPGLTLPGNLSTIAEKWMLRVKAPTKRQTPLKTEGCEGGHRSHLWFVHISLEVQHLLPEHLLWHWVTSTSPVCARLCQAPLPSPPVSSQQERCFFFFPLDPNLCRSSYFQLQSSAAICWHVRRQTSSC